MKHSKYILIILLFFAVSSTGKSTSVPNKYDDYISVAIHDFAKKSPLFKRDTVFSVRVMEISDEIIGIIIYGATGKAAVVRKGEYIDQSTLPSRYMEINGKLFLWRDKDIAVKQDVITILKKYNHIDTAILGVYYPAYNIDELKKGEDYYFCKHNIQKFKKVRTNKVMGKYPIPNLNCN